MKKTVAFLLLPLVFFLFFSADFPKKSEKRELPVLMYHSVSDKGKSKYIVPPKKLEEDFASLRREGYEAVTLQDLYDFIAGETLPEKPILITFDDGHYNNLLYALPLLEKYDMHAVVHVIGSFTEYATAHPEDSRNEHAYLTWDDIKTLEKSGRFEIGNHTYDMHKFSPRFGVGRKQGEDDATYETVFRKDVKRLNGKLNEVCENPITAFAYPFGRYNSIAQKTLLEEGFRITFTCSEGNNVIEQGKSESLIHLKRYNRDSAYTSEKVLELIRPKRA